MILTIAHALLQQLDPHPGLEYELAGPITTQHGPLIYLLLRPPGDRNWIAYTDFQEDHLRITAGGKDDKYTHIPYTDHNLLNKLNQELAQAAQKHTNATT